MLIITNLTRGPFLERPSKLSGPISMINHPVSPRELFGCLLRLPLFSILLIFPVYMSLDILKGMDVLNKVRTPNINYK